jgi:hypothetical protein
MLINTLTLWSVCQCPRGLTQPNSTVLGLPFTRALPFGTASGLGPSPAFRWSSFLASLASLTVHVWAFFQYGLLGSG